MPTSDVRVSPLPAAGSATARRALAIGAGALVMTLAARTALPLPGTPVPVTLQDLAALVLGGALGAVAGPGGVLLYLALGAAGLPVFAAGGGPAYLVGPTGGYLLAFPLAAWVTARWAGPGFARSVLAALAGLALIHAGGVSWLALQTGSTEAALRIGSLPFLATGAVKVALAGGLIALLRPRLRPGL
jgi:biotin transport system substrate-specific component